MATDSTAIAGRKTEMIGMRVSPEALADIDARAQQRRMTRTDYMVAAALGQINTENLSVEERFDGLAERIARLETLAFGT